MEQTHQVSVELRYGNQTRPKLRAGECVLYIHRKLSLFTWNGNIKEDVSSQACLALQGTPTSQQTRHCSVICSRIFFLTVSTIAGSAANSIKVFKSLEESYNARK